MIFCKNCGAQLDDSARFCNNCGSTVEAQAAPQPQQTYTAQPVDNSQHDGLSTTSMVMGILSLVLGGGILGIIFGAIARSKAKQYLFATGTLNGKAKAGKIMGTIGLILSIVCLVLIVLYFIFVVVIGVAAASEATSYSSYYYY